jgi:hypothetical protein
MTDNNPNLTQTRVNLKAAEKAGPVTSVTVEDLYHEEYQISDKAIKSAKELTVYNTELFDSVDTIENDGDRLEDLEGDEWAIVTPAQIKAIKKLLDTPEKLYKLEDLDGSECVLNSEKYQAIKGLKGATRGFRFFAPLTYTSYHVIVQAKSLKIGCTEYSLSYWRDNLDRIVRANLGNQEAQQEVAVAFRAFLPDLERLTAKLQSKSPERKAAKKGAKKARKKPLRRREIEPYTNRLL